MQVPDLIKQRICWHARSSILSEIKKKKNENHLLLPSSLFLYR
jgi:hypothetical protein